EGGFEPPTACPQSRCATTAPLPGGVKRTGRRRTTSGAGTAAGVACGQSTPHLGREPSMSDKPTYLGLLNAIALAECAAHGYLEEWIKVTPHDGVRGVLQTVSAREGEHGMAFAKRINELGYTVLPKDDPGQAKRMKIAASDK